MKINTIRSIIALTVVGVFMAITGTMALFPIITGTNVDLNSYADFFNKTAGVYTGIVGVIIGFYFGRSIEGPSARDRPSL